MNICIIHKSQKVETTQVSIDRWMDTQNVLYTYNGLLFGCKKEGNSDTCYNLDEPQRQHAKPDTKGQILDDSTYLRYLE